MAGARALVPECPGSSQVYKLNFSFSIKTTCLNYSSDVGSSPKSHMLPKISAHPQSSMWSLLDVSSCSGELGFAHSFFFLVFDKYSWRTCYVSGTAPTAIIKHKKYVPSWSLYSSWGREGDERQTTIRK